MYKYIVFIIVVILSYTASVRAETVKCWFGGYNIIDLRDVVIEAWCIDCTSFIVVEKDGTKHTLPVDMCHIIRKK